MKFSLLMSLVLGTALAPGLARADAPATTVATAPQRNFFFPIHDLSQWKRSAGATPREVVLTSPPLSAPLQWNELVPSWNAALPAGTYLTLEISATHPAAAAQPAVNTKFYCLGRWSSDPMRHFRGSLNGQADAMENVETDTLVLKQHGGDVTLRLTLGSDDRAQLSADDLVSKIRFMGLSFMDSGTPKVGEQPNHDAWGKTVPVPERFQMDYKEEGGAVWCSPTSVSMILAHWSDTTKRPELTMTVPQVAHAVNDPEWPGTGNWAFNMAFAGSFPGMRAYVTRFDDLTEVEDWIAAGVPVALSVNYGLLKGEGKKGSGHLVVCNGFAANGDVIIADPGRHTLPGEKFRTFPRADVIAGWGASSNTVYLVYPESMTPPANVMHHWDSTN